MVNGEWAGATRPVGRNRRRKAEGTTGRIANTERQQAALRVKVSGASKEKVGGGPQRIGCGGLCDLKA